MLVSFSSNQMHSVSLRQIDPPHSFLEKFLNLWPSPKAKKENCFLKRYYLSNHSAGCVCLGEKTLNTIYFSFILSFFFLVSFSTASNEWNLFMQIWFTESQQVLIGTDKTQLHIFQMHSELHYFVNSYNVFCIQPFKFYLIMCLPV